MQVDRVIVHFLRKAEKQLGAEVDCSEQVLPSDQQSDLLVRRLDAAYRNQVITNAIFDQAGSSKFPVQFKTYFKKGSESAFVDFSQRAAEELRARVEKIPQAKGGFLVFSQYMNAWEKCMAVFLIRDTNGMLFRKHKQSGSYAINPADHLDLDRLAMACKINLQKYEPVQGKYLSYIKRNMEVISQYFVDWIAASGSETSSLYTANLYSLLEGLAEDELPREAGKPILHAALKKRIYDSIKSTPGGVVNLVALSSQFYGEEGKTFLADTAANRGMVMDTEFQADTKELRRLVRIEVDADGILLRFSPKDKQSKVRLDKDRVIIESKEFARKYREELGLNGAS